METENNLTILSAMTNIIVAARCKNESSEDAEFFSYDDELMNKIQDEASFLASEFDITARQAVLFCIIVELSKGDNLTKKDLAKSLRTDFIKLLSYETDLQSLEKAYLIQRGYKGNIFVREAVGKCLEKNIKYQKPEIENLTTFTILLRIESICKDILYSHVDKILELSRIDDMILMNPNTSIAKVANKYKILCRGAMPSDGFDRKDEFRWTNNDYDGCMPPAERLLFYSLCYFFSSESDDQISWWSMKSLFEENVLESLQTDFKFEQLYLQINKVITYASVDGVADKSHFKIEDSVKEEIWEDCGGLPESAPLAGTLRHEKLPVKKLFYDIDLAKDVDTLTRILSQERYEQVKSALIDKGMRSGFTCLFYGDPGTGKTETVYQLARETGRDIVMVDVSKLRSMWVGESEKNVKSLFAKYRNNVHRSKVAPILLFNEADAIFGVRMSGADRSVDKMENSIQNIILQEMEDLEGILIATTNLSENFDKAFERRFLYKIKFQKPSITVKAHIWKAMLPELTDTDARSLSSKFDFSGGQIENIVRKRTIQSLLYGATPTFEDLLRFCYEEARGAGAKMLRIGF